MNEITDVRKVRNVNDLISYFATKLGWNIDLDSFESIDDFSYGFTAEDLGLNADSFAKIKSLRQLRPFDEQQRWGLFCIEFDSGKFEVSALRKVLSGLIPRRRNADRANVWNQNDILFLCDWGETANRTIGIAHFEEREKGLAQIKMICCEPSSAIADAHGDIRTFETRIARLAWPEDPTNTKDWSRAWSEAFTTAYRETIKKSAELTQELAKVAKSIRDGVLKTMEVENAKGSVHNLWEKFKHSLIADMSKEDFADMYAQTMVYGLFSARCMDKTSEDFSVEEAIDCIPSTNPFLKNLMSASVGVRGPQDRLDFDELEIDNVVNLLQHTNMTQIVEDFNRQSGGGKEDPVLYFYEGFAKAYDKEKKMACGEFYTPVPVVNFIVRAVDDILKRDFGYADGLATTAMKKVKYVRESKRLVNGSRTQVVDEKDVPAVQILDVATGTGTFIRQTILRIYENFKTKHAGTPEGALKLAWNVYVNKNLLPRLNGFEINMAPYAVAHMKLAMALKDTGYDFRGNERLRVYLTNSLEEPGSDDLQGKLWEDPLATESVFANAAKKNTGINIVIGNPPYNKSSSNRGSWIVKLIGDYKKDLKEKKINLDDDYIKFIRYGQYLVERGDLGILAYISNNSFLDGITHRQMRKELMRVFDDIYVLNLHGSTFRKKEVCPDGSKDENVFEIAQGVSINVFVRRDRLRNFTPSLRRGIHYADVWGLRESKYKFLVKKQMTDVEWQEISPVGPNWFFVPKDFMAKDDYDLGFSVNELMPVSNSGIQTKRDSLVVSFDIARPRAVLNDFMNLTVDELRIKYNLTADGRDWTVAGAKDDLRQNDPRIMKYLYRPFDMRYTLYTGKSRGFMGYPRDSVMSMMRDGNVAVTGEGEIFGNGSAWNPPAKARDAIGCSEGLRPRGLFFADSSGIRLEDFLLRDAACWGIVFKRCADVVARAVRVDSVVNANNDGFDVEARDVLIERCDVNSGDDAYCIKSNDPDFVVENVVVRDCVARTHCNALKLGTASHGTMRNIRFENCRVEAPTRVYRDLAPMPADLSKENPVPGAPTYLCGAGISAICVECVDGGTVEDILFDGIDVSGCQVPIFVRGGRRMSRACGIPPGDRRVLRDVVIRRVRGRAESEQPSTITGVAGCRPQNIRLEDVSVVCRGGRRDGAADGEPGAQYDGSYPEGNMFRRLHLPAYGLYVQNADAVSLKNVRFDLRPDAPSGESRPPVFGAKP